MGRDLRLRLVLRYSVWCCLYQECDTYQGTFSEPHFAALYRKALNFIMSTTNRTSGRGVVVMSIDNLPAQLPREATDYFGSLLLPFIEDSVSLPRVHNCHLCGTTYVCGWRR